jgi:phosphate transport system substrate-binding protein
MKGILRKTVGLAVTVCVLFIGQMACAQERSKEVVRVRGSESMSHNVTVYALDYSPSHLDCNIVVSGGATDSGLSYLLDGTAEIAMATSPPNAAILTDAKAKGLDLKEAVVGWGGIVVVTHPSNPVEALTVDQLRRLLTGEFSSWKQVGGPDKPVLVVAFSEGARVGTFNYVTNQLLLGRTFAPASKILPYIRLVPPSVAENEGAIGLLRVRNLERLIEQGVDKQIKVLGIKKDDRSPAIVPGRESVDEGTYPLTRPYMLYIPANKASKCAVDFFKFCEARNPRPRDVKAATAK